MRVLFLSILLALLGGQIQAQSFEFDYDGPDTLFVDENCMVPLDWGHPDQPTVTSTIGATIDSFYLYSITDDYELNEMIGAGLNLDITYKAVDDQGNEDFFTFTLLSHDALFPELLSGPFDQSMNCGEAGVQAALQAWYDDQAGIEASDNCQLIVQADLTWEETLIEFNQSTNDLCGNTKSVELSFSISDEAGNSLPEVSATFQTIDDEDPYFTALPSALDTFCEADIDAILEAYIDDKGGAEAGDNCSEDLTWQIVWSDNSGDFGIETIGNKPYDLQVNTGYCDYTVNITFIATDDCGNQKANSTSITISDNNIPYFTDLPQDSTVDCDGIPDVPEVVALDDCKGELIVLFESSSNQGSDPLSTDYYNYVITQSWSTSDGCGHEISHTRYLTVQDTTAPEFSLPADITVSCTDYEDTDLTGIPIDVVDACCAFLEVEYSDRIEGLGCTYTVFRDWTVRDVSGNEKTRTQKIFIEDQKAPDLILLPVDQDIYCYSSSSPESEFQDWINSFGGAEFQDDCNAVNAFAALPGSYQLEDPSTFPGTRPNSDFLLNCSATDKTVMFLQEVDFVFYDDCGNAVVHKRSFRVVDDVDPFIEVCPGDSSIILAEDECAVEWEIGYPIASDNCTGSPLEWSYQQVFPIQSSEPGATNIPVDTLSVSLGPINLDVLDLEDLLALQLSFYNLDADDNNEYFVIRGEDGSILGTTPEIDEECGDFVLNLMDLITLEQLEIWVDDEYLELLLEPYIVPEGGIFSINDICGNSYVEFSLRYTTEAISQLTYSYSIDGGEFALLNTEELPKTVLDAGEHTISYRVSDCAENEVECTQRIDVVDQQAPVITCPEDVLIQLPMDTCSMELALPDNFGFYDNCQDPWFKTSVQPLDSLDRFIHFSYVEESDQFVANNKNLSFESDYSIFSYQPELLVFIQGDIDEFGEYFEILDEDGNLIGQTPAGSCDSVTEKRFALDESLFHSWKEDGLIQFVARSQIGSEAINPCDDQMVVEDGDHDGSSVIYMELRYQAVNLKYSISGATEVALQDYEAGEIPPQHVFYGGTSSVQYFLYDEAGNADTCSFEIELEDRQAPVARCKEAIAIFINPSGIDDYILTAEEVDDGSYDNCRIDSMAVQPSVFDCSQAGSTLDVTLYVWDAYGNVDSCMTSVKVETMVLQPSYQAGVCAFDTLKLFANLPAAPEDIYTILWKKENNGFSSNEENPVRPNADASYSGTYTLEVTGLDACFSTGFVEVFIEDLSTPIVTSSQDSICTGEDVVLETNNYSGNVWYKWYRGIAPNGALIDSTNVSAIEVTPMVGNNDYYVVVEGENCISLPSAKKSITVLQTPEAKVNNPFISICEGDQIVLGTNVSGPNFNYLWWGPDSYQSTNQNPMSITDAGIENQGTYRLAVFNGICSDTALVEVLVNERPLTPKISGDSLYCEGESIILSVNNITNADTYSWYQPNGDLYTVDNSNTLVIPNATDIYSGDWQVVAKEGSCYSDTSDVKSISVELTFEISASNNGPVCEGDSIELFAPEIPGAQYFWIGPENDTLLVARPKIEAKAGIYQLQVVTEAGCFINASTEVEVVKVPEITALSNNAPDCIDGSECIEFKPSVFPNLDNYTYSWSGPNDFTSSDSIAVLCQPNSGDNGIYSLYVSNGLCQSESVSTEVEMYEYPEKPILNASGLICETDTLTLSLLNVSSDDLLYFWSTPNGNVFQTGTPELILPQAELVYSGYYSIQTYNGHCYSQPSDSVMVEVLKKPNQPVAWTDEAFCEGEAIYLYTNYLEGASYYWEGPNGFRSEVQNPVISPSDTLNEGVYRLTVSVNGCYSEISEAVVVNIKRKPYTPQLSGNAGPICLSDSTVYFELCLDNQQAAASYQWYHNNSGVLIGEGSSNCISINRIPELIDGQNGFYALAELDACWSDASELFQVDIDLLPDKLADAGEDIVVCDDTELTLSANPDPEGSWLPAQGGMVISDPLNPESPVSGLQEGDNLFVWSLSHGVCENYDRDSIFVYIIPTPVAVDDYYQTGYKQDVELDPIENDGFSEEGEILIDLESVSYGSLSDEGMNRFLFSPSPTFVGEISIPYTLVHEECRNKFSEGFIQIKVSDASDCFGVNVITPNGDGVNDALLFPCLENPLYPKNKLIIFNQWGDEVYSASPYLNDWQGTYLGKDLPVGTYYYILDLRNGSTPVRDFFVIER
jgi:gliding motility-associated-like protein